LVNHKKQEHFEQIFSTDLQERQNTIVRELGAPASIPLQNALVLEK